jgi:hypothetical protein
MTVEPRCGYRIDCYKKGNPNADAEYVDQGPVPVMTKFLYHIPIIHECSLLLR